MKNDQINEKKINLKLQLSMILAMGLFSHASMAASDIQTYYTSTDVSWILPSGYDSAEISVGNSSVNGMSFSVIDENGVPRPDGYYAYHVSANPQEMADDLAAMKAAREAGDSNTYSQLANKLQEGSAYSSVSTSGAFEIKEGLIEEYDPEARERAAQETQALAQAENQTEEEENE